MKERVDCNDGQDSKENKVSYENKQHLFERSDVPDDPDELLDDAFSEFLYTGQNPLPLRDHLKMAGKYNQLDIYCKEGDRQWQSPCFSFVRYMRSHPDLKSKTAMQAWNIILPLFDEVDVDMDSLLRGTHDIYDYDDMCSEFLDVWDTIRIPAGSNPIKAAYDAAKKNPVIESGREVKAYDLFLSLCAHMPEITGGENFYLPQEKVADEMGKHVKTISRFCKWAKSDGYLTVIRQADHSKRKATYYRFQDVTNASP